MEVLVANVSMRFTLEDCSSPPPDLSVLKKAPCASGSMWEHMVTVELSELASSHVIGASCLMDEN